MNKKDFIISFLFITSFFSLSAQEESSRTLVSEEVEYGQPNKTYNTYKTTWKKNDLKDNWTVAVGGGAQFLWGIDDDKGEFMDRLTFSPQISISKNFSPIWGLRLSFSGGSLHGYNDGREGTYSKWNQGSENYMGKGAVDTPGYPTGGPSVSMLSWDPQWNYMGATLENGQILLVNGLYQWVPGLKGALYMDHVRYARANIEFTFDLFNLIGNYNPKRFFELTPFMGVGIYRTFAYRGHFNSFVAGINTGFIGKFRITDRIGIHAEISGTAIGDNFDGQLGDDFLFDAIAQSSLSIAYKLGRTDWEVCEPMDYELVNRLNDEINTLRDRNAKLAAKECPTCPPPPPVKVEPKADIKFLPDPVFFRIDKSVIDPTEWLKIDKAAKYLNDHPEASVVVTGYADKQTAYPEYNMKLSERRSKIVSKALIEKYGINSSRVSINWSGDQIQPFKVNEWNRVVIFVIE